MAADRKLVPLVAVEFPMTRWYLKQQFRFVQGPVHGALYDMEQGTVTRVLAPLAPRLAAWIAGAEPEAADTEVLAHLQQAGYLTQDPAVATSETSLRATNSRRRRMAWLELTPQCNYRCIHCYAESSPQRTGTLPTERWRSLVQEVAEAGFEVLQFTGGDPSVHPEMISLVELAHAAGIPLVEVYTNAMRLKPEWLDTFARLGTHMAVSFYGPDAETYESITAVPGSFARVVRNLGLVLQAGIPLRIGLVLMPENEGKEQATREFLVELGIDPSRISADAVRPTGRGDGHMISAASTSPAHGFVSLESLTSSAAAVAVDSDHFPWAQYRLPSRFRSSGEAAEYASCWNGELAVTPEGDVIPCIFARDTAMGSVAQAPLATVIGSPQVQDIWNLNLGDSDTCKTCEFRYACFDCRALTVAVTGASQAKPPGCRYDPGQGVLALAGLTPAQRQALKQLVPVPVSMENLSDGLVQAGSQLAELDAMAQACLFAFRQGLSVAACLELIAEAFPAEPLPSLEEDMLQWLLQMQSAGLLVLSLADAPVERSDGARG